LVTNKFTRRPCKIHRHRYYALCSEKCSICQK